MDSHVSELALRVRGEDTDAAVLGASAEAFARDVLARCDEVLEGRAPGRVLLMRELDLSLRLRASSLGDPAEVEAVALAIADNLEQRGARSDDVAAFADEIDWRAAHAAAWANGTSRGDWRFEALEVAGEPLRLLRDASEPRPVVALLQRLRDEGWLGDVVQALPDEVVDAVAATLRRVGLDSATPAAMDEPQGAGSLARGDAGLRSASRDFVVACIRGSGAGGAGRDHADRREGSRPSASVAAPEGALSAIDTRFGGACYLLPLVLEWGVADALWTACLPEGLVLTHAITELLGPEADGDPIAALLGGATPATAKLTVSSEQQHEVALDAYASLLEALERGTDRRALVARVDLVELAGRRWLVVTEDQTPNVVLALDATRADALTLALDAFLARWPASAPNPLASPALVIADARGRLRAGATASPIGLASCLRDGRPAAALVAQVAGSLACLFTARLDDDCPSREVFAARWLAKPARAISTPTAIEVHLPMSAIDLELRRVGLDCDPGYVPWLDRHVRVVFDED